jgi:hypothetical protein
MTMRMVPGCFSDCSRCRISGDCYRVNVRCRRRQHPSFWKEPMILQLLLQLLIIVIASVVPIELLLFRDTNRIPVVSAFVPVRTQQQSLFIRHTTLEHDQHRHRELLSSDIATSIQGITSNQYSTRLRMSSSSSTGSSNNEVNRNASDDNNNNDDDALSKLIGKRNQIKRQKRETIEVKLAASIEPVVDLDLDQLPEFKVQRTPRSRKTSDTNDDDDDDDASTVANKKDTPIIDFMADYEDENDWHVPNRMGISSISWGDVGRNFVVSSTKGSDSGGNKNTGKLTKRMQKMGKFVAGDVQLAIQKLLSGGIVLIETSGSYGMALRGQKLSAHDILKECVTDAIDGALPEPIIVESLGRNDLSTLKSILYRPTVSMVSKLESTLGRLGVSNSGAVDMFMVPKYFGIPTRFIAAGLAAQLSPDKPITLVFLEPPEYRR